MLARTDISHAIRTRRPFFTLVLKTAAGTGESAGMAEASGYTESMARTLTLDEHSEELLEEALRTGPYRTPEEVVARALEALQAKSAPELERRRQAVDNLLAFGEKHHLSLGEGVRIKDLIHKGHKY